MPLRCAGAFCRSGMRPTPSPPDAVWITNAVLLRAIERFHHVHSVPCRRLSSCPGPIESRRRLGKRHMTAILPESHPSPLPWTIDLPFNLGEWNWEAPTAPENRHKVKKKLGLLERLIRWLEGPAQDDSSTSVPTPTAPAEAISEAQEVLVGLGDELAKFRLVDSRLALYQACEPYMQRLFKLMQLRMISRDDLILALDPFDLHIRERVPRQILDCVHAWYLESVINAIHAGRIRPSHDAYGPEFWQRFFDQVIELTPQGSTFRLFQNLVIKGVQKIHFRTVPEYHLRLFRAHIMYQASLPRQDAMRAAARHARLFREVKYFRKGGLIVHCRTLVKSCLSIPGDAEYRKRIAIHLLQTLAHMSPLTKSSFAHFANWISDPAEIGDGEAYFLVRARLISRARNRANAATYYRRSMFIHRGDHWRWLIKAALSDSTDRQHQNLRTLTHSCRLFGNLSELLTAAARMKHGGTILRDILTASQDPRVAVAAWETYNNGRQRKAKWSWHLWLPYIRALVQDPEMDFSVVWEAVDLLPFKSIKNLPPAFQCYGIGDKMQLLEKMGGWFMVRPDVTPRQRLRFIERCIAYGKVAGQSMSKGLMSNLAILVIKDLEEGSLGRTSRLQYLIKMTELHFGREEAARMEHQLEGWRWVVVNQGFGTKPKTKFVLDEELDELQTEIDGYRTTQELGEMESRHERHVQESPEAGDMGQCAGEGIEGHA
ncbi:hypothetical protein ACHAPT_002095 [Fusarium lateritium]